MAAGLVVFGVQHVLYAAFVATLVPAWIPAHLFWAYFVGVAFFAAALGLLWDRTVPLAGTWLGVMFLVFVVTTHIPRIATHLGNGNEWTSGLVALAMCGVAWVMARGARPESAETRDPLQRIGSCFFGVAMLAFGILHFIPARLTIRVGPPWLEAHPLWAYLMGASHSPNARNYFPARRSSFGVASQTSWPVGGEIRFSSTSAAPAFFKAVTWCFEPSAVEITSSNCGA
jgi:uncharacterized membrane protein